MTYILGNISKAGETRQVMVNGIPTLVTDFTVANNENDDTQFIKCSIWRERGAKLEQYLYLGRPVFIEGHLKDRAYLDKNGDPRSELRMSNPTVKFPTGNKKVETGFEELPAEDEKPF